MEAIIKFIFTHGLKYYAGALLLAVIILYVVYWIRLSRKRKLYEEKYKRLAFFVDYSLTNEMTKKAIEAKFKELWQFGCRNKEKLQVLEQTFYKKFSK